MELTSTIQIEDLIPLRFIHVHLKYPNDLFPFFILINIFTCFLFYVSPVRAEI